MKLFGEYLIDKKIVTADALAKALVQQIKSLPSLVEIVYENQWMKPMDLIQILKTQHRNHSSFLETARGLGLWKQEWQEKVDSRLSAERIPLGEVLVSMGALQADQLTKALDDFFGEGMHLKKDVEEKEPSPQQKVAMPQTQQGFAVYLELFSEGFANHWLEFFKLEPSGHMSRDNLKKGWGEIHKLKGAARLASIEHSSKMISKLEEVLEEMLKRKIEKFPQDLLAKIPPVLKTSFELLWALRGSLAKDADEGSLLKDGPFSKAFHECLDALEVIKFDLEFVDLEAKSDH